MQPLCHGASVAQAIKPDPAISPAPARPAHLQPSWKAHCFPWTVPYSPSLVEVPVLLPDETALAEPLAHTGRGHVLTPVCLTLCSIVRRLSIKACTEKKKMSDTCVESDSPEPSHKLGSSVILPSLSV